MKNNIHSVELGMHLKVLRLGKKLSIEKLAYKTGISYTLLYKIEKGAVNTSFLIILKILSNLDCEAQHIAHLFESMMTSIKNDKSTDL
ncbi:MAG: helix-turn-helix protein [Bacteroidota bacterium]|jgi:transcriptional regulator with XRE-family HTH domain